VRQALRHCMPGGVKKKDCAVNDSFAPAYNFSGGIFVRTCMPWCNSASKLFVI
jgi:hypothetical protein